MGGQSKCPGETGTSRRESGVSIYKIVDRCGADMNSLCQNLAIGTSATFGVVIQNLSPTGNLVILFYIYYMLMVFIGFYYVGDDVYYSLQVDII